MYRLTDGSISPTFAVGFLHSQLLPQNVLLGAQLIEGRRQQLVSPLELHLLGEGGAVGRQEDARAGMLVEVFLNEGLIVLRPDSRREYHCGVYRVYQHGIRRGSLLQNLSTPILVRPSNMYTKNLALTTATLRLLCHLAFLPPQLARLALAHLALHLHASSEILAIVPSILLHDLGTYPDELLNCDRS